jgi:hypothetical protein
MPDPLLSEAIREAYASAPVEAIAVDTLELWHPAFTAAVRVAAGGRALDARLEDDAPRDAGAMVTFLPVPFRLVPPAVTDEGAAELRVEIDNVEREVSAQLSLAVTSPAPVEILWRRYLLPTAGDGPEMVLRGLHLQTAGAGLARVTATAGWPDLVNEAFPRLAYRAEQFPTLDFT